MEKMEKKERKEKKEGEEEELQLSLYVRIHLWKTHCL